MREVPTSDRRLDGGGVDGEVLGNSHGERRERDEECALTHGETGGRRNVRTDGDLGRRCWMK